MQPPVFLLFTFHVKPFSVLFIGLISIFTTGVRHWQSALHLHN
jgi:hypothetical protein